MTFTWNQKEKCFYHFWWQPSNMAKQCKTDSTDSVMKERAESPPFIFLTLFPRPFQFRYFCLYSIFNSIRSQNLAQCLKKIMNWKTKPDQTSPTFVICNNYFNARKVFHKITTNKRYLTGRNFKNKIQAHPCPEKDCYSPRTARI